MKTINFEIAPIIYRRKQIDTGIILGARKFRWMLRRKYSPLYAKDLGDKTYISALTPHKRNFQVYIPSSMLTVGQKILIHRHDYKKDVIKQTLKVVKVSRNCGIFGLGDSVTCELEKEEIIEAKVEIEVKTGAKDKDGSLGGEYVFGGEKTPETRFEASNDAIVDEDMAIDWNEWDFSEFQAETDKEDVSKDAYIDSLTSESQEEPLTTDVPTLFVLPGSQSTFELSARAVTRRTFLQVVCLHTPTHTQRRTRQHDEQFSLKLPVMPLDRAITPKNRIKSEQLPLIVFEGYQYGLFGG